MSETLAFCRLVIGLAFLIAFVGKARNTQSFQQALIAFRLLPARLSVVAAFLVLSSEVWIIVCMLVGFPLLELGFLLALILLIVFSTALAIVMVRKQRIRCNCFGASGQLVSPTELWRNAGLGHCATGGYAAQCWSSQGQSMGVMEWLLMTIVATIFVLLWTQLRSLVQLFR